MGLVRILAHVCLGIGILVAGTGGAFMVLMPFGGRLPNDVWVGPYLWLALAVVLTAAACMVPLVLWAILKTMTESHELQRGLLFEIKRLHPEGRRDMIRQELEFLRERGVSGQGTRLTDTVT